MTEQRPYLYVCLTCRAGRELAEGATPPGALLHAELTRLADHSVTLRTVTCMASCESGCAAAIAMPGKWTNLLGRLDVPLAADLLAYARLYAASPTGTVMPSKRPASLHPRMVLGRVPDMVATDMAA